MHQRMGSRTPAWCAVVASLLMAGCLGIGSCSETGAVVGRTLSLQAMIETANASIDAEVLDGQDTTFTILMDEID